MLKIVLKMLITISTIVMVYVRLRSPKRLFWVLHSFWLWLTHSIIFVLRFHKSFIQLIFMIHYIFFFLISNTHCSPFWNTLWPEEVDLSQIILVLLKLIETWYRIYFIIVRKRLHSCNYDMLFFLKSPWQNGLVLLIPYLELMHEPHPFVVEVWMVAF